MHHNLYEYLLFVNQKFLFNLYSAGLFTEILKTSFQLTVLERVDETLNNMATFTLFTLQNFCISYEFLIRRINLKSFIHFLLSFLKKWMKWSNLLIARSSCRDGQKMESALMSGF